QPLERLEQMIGEQSPDALPLTIGIDGEGVDACRDRRLMMANQTHRPASDLAVGVAGTLTDGHTTHRGLTAKQPTNLRRRKSNAQRKAGVLNQQQRRQIGKTSRTDSHEKREKQESTTSG